MSEIIATSIQQSPLLRHLPAEKLSSISQSATLHVYDAGAVLIEEGTPTENLFLLVEGLVRVTTVAMGQHVELKDLGPGSYFGEVSALSGKAATATVTAVAPCRVVRIPRSTVVALVDEDEQVRTVLEGVTLARAKDTLGKVLK